MRTYHRPGVLSLSAVLQCLRQWHAFQKEERNIGSDLHSHPHHLLFRKVRFQEVIQSLQSRSRITASPSEACPEGNSLLDLDIETPPL